MLYSWYLNLMRWVSLLTMMAMMTVKRKRKMMKVSMIFLSFLCFNVVTESISCSSVFNQLESRPVCIQVYIQSALLESAWLGQCLFSFSQTEIQPMTSAIYKTVRKRILISIWTRACYTCWIYEWLNVQHWQRSQRRRKNQKVVHRKRSQRKTKPSLMRNQWKRVTTLMKVKRSTTFQAVPGMHAAVFIVKWEQYW